MSLQPPVDNIAIRTCEEGDIAAIAVIYAYHILHGLASFEIEPERSINVRTVSIAPSRGCA